MENLKSKIKKNSLLIRIAVLVLTVSCAAMALSQTVFAKNTFVITDGDQVTVHTTYETNPADVLDEAGLELNEEDTYETLPGEGVSEITVKRGMNVVIDYCDEKIEAVAYGETVGELFDSLGIKPREQSDVSVSLDDVTYDGMEIVISTTVVSTESYTLSVPYEIVYKETDFLKAGKEVVLSKGEDGQKEYTAEVTYVNGAETERVVLSETVTVEPVAQVVAIGTGDGSKKSGKPIVGDGVIITAAGDVLKFTHRETFKATAYCRTDVGGEITSTGTVTRVGAIAVDPKVIPYGTEMFILTKDGKYIYGIATAEDCGGSIKGKRLDLFYETYNECIRFGVRDCDVYFLA